MSDLLAAFAGRRFDLIVSNPPYVAEAELGRLEPEVVEYEPRLALVAGERGDELLLALATGAAGCLRPGGWVAFECGLGQPPAVAAALELAGFERVQTWADLAGMDRFVEGRLP